MVLKVLIWVKTQSFFIRTILKIGMINILFLNLWFMIRYYVFMSILSDIMW